MTDLMASAHRWRVRWQTPDGAYTSARVHRAGSPLPRAEVEAWVEAQVRLHPDKYARLALCCPLEAPSNHNAGGTSACNAGLGIVGRITGGRTAYAHNIRRIGADHYRLSWSFDTKIAGSRLRWPRTITRDTDEAGALRFAKKWGCSMPNAGAVGRAR